MFLHGGDIDATRRRAIVSNASVGVVDDDDDKRSPSPEIVVFPNGGVSDATQRRAMTMTMTVTVTTNGLES